MNVVRDCPAAKWLPARHHFALMRLIAFLRCKVEDSRPRLSEERIDRLILAIDRDQSAIENYGVSIWLFITVVCYVAAVLPLQSAIAVFVAIPLASIALQAPFHFIGAIAIPLWNSVRSGSKIENNLKLNSFFLMTVLVIASSFFATMSSPVRYVAWFFFAVIVLNACAWVLMALLRNSVHELERRCGM